MPTKLCTASSSPPLSERVFSSGGDLGGLSAEMPLVHKHWQTVQFPRLFSLIG